MAERPGEMDERDVDERFASIVARWEGSVPDAAAGPDAPVAPTDGGAATGGAPAVGGDAAPDTAETAAEPPAPRPARPPWVNPSPLEVVVPASAWRSEPPADDETRAAAAAAEADLDDEHYEPPPVVLPPQEDLHFWGAVVGLVAGPLMLLYVVFARPFHSTRWFIASVLVSLVGFGLLVLRQPRSRDELDGDDGARV
ncbi:hypothetical protein ACK8HX_03105 [Oryzobacter sp. R7]|uniref:hypothetical protein n=1 Tax=Oryzobacter faecalis TaxID=3388656 RepID=UPI00398D5EE6